MSEIKQAGAPRRSRSDAARLAVLAQYHVVGTGPEQAFDDLVVLASQLCGTPMAAVSLVDEHRLWLKAEVGIGLNELPRSESFCSSTIADPTRPLVVPDASVDLRFARSPLVAEEPHIRFYAGIPLLSSSGVPLGSLCALDTEARQLSAEQLRALQGLARQVEVQLELRRELGELALSLAEQQIVASDLADGEPRFATAFAEAPVPMALTSPHGRFLHVNDALCDLVGRQRDTLIGTSASTLIAAEALADEAALRRRLLGGEARIFVRDATLLTGDGARVAVTVTTSTICSPTGEPLFLLSQLEDISQRRLAESALASTNIALEAIVACDSAGMITFWNPSAETMFGFRSAEMLGKPMTIIIPERHRAGHIAGIARLEAGRRGADGGDHGQGHGRPARRIGVPRRALPRSARAQGRRHLHRRDPRRDRAHGTAGGAPPPGEL